MTDQRHSPRQSAALERIATAMERIADTLQSLDEPQTFDLQHDRDGRVIQIKEVPSL